MRIHFWGSVHNTRVKVFNFSPTQIIVLGFVILISAGTFLLNLPVAARSGKSVGFVDALFTSTSASCITGFVVLDTNSTWSHFGQIVILLLIQVGGLGIMSAATLFTMFLGRHIGIKERLTIQESLNEFSLSGMVRTLKNIVVATIIIEIIGAFILSFRLIPMYGFSDGLAKSIFHSVSAFCNAGFDLFGTEEEHFVSLLSFQKDPLVILTVSFLIIVGGLGFIVWKDIFINKHFRRYILHTKVVLALTAILTLAGMILTFIFEYNNTLSGLPLPSKLLNAYFHSVSSRTAGFNTFSIADMTEISKFTTIILMFIGAAPGSTGGGIKVTTFSVIIFTVISSIKGSEEVNMFKRGIPVTIIMKSISIIILSLGVVFTTTMILMINNEGSFLNCLYESTSAFGTVGIATGITPNLNTVSKIAIMITMFMGRIGPLSVAIALAMRRKKTQQLFKYPEGRITVG